MILSARMHLLLLFVAGVAARAQQQQPEEEAPAPACGLACSASPRGILPLRSCLDEAFPPNDGVRLGFHGVPKVTFPEDELYALARRASYGKRQPAVVVMAEDEDDVVAAVNCAVGAGYKVSPRGRGHSFQALSTMDGYVVIDCSLLCDPETFEVSKEGGDWILPGQKYLGTLTSGSGCTNAVMLAAAHKAFDPADGALYAIGTCPSVGIVGYTTGGGAGDVTPYVGWGADDFLEARIVLWDGSVVTASATQNADLFWATQGGGSGFGVVTAITTVVPQAPAPPSSSSGEAGSRKFCFVDVTYVTPDDESRRKFLLSFQDYLYEVDPLVSTKFGGGGHLGHESKRLFGIFLGSAAEFLANFRENGLLEEDALDPSGTSKLMQNYEVLCDGTSPCDGREDLPSAGVEIAEFGTYGEAMLYNLCSSISPIERYMGGYSSYTQTSGDWCADLSISEEFCTTRAVYESWPSLETCTALGFPQDVCEEIMNNGLTQEKCLVLLGQQEFCDLLLAPFYNEPHCHKQEVIEALLEAAYNPLSFMNNAGPGEWFIPFYEGGDYDSQPTVFGGLLIPKVDIDTLLDLDELGLPLNHLQHGAPLMKASEATAFPMRDTAIMTQFKTGDHMKSVAGRMAEFYGSETALQGYYNYMNPVGNPNWRQYYFGGNYERLSQIKLKYDPLNTFGNPMQVEPAIPEVPPSSEPSQSPSASENLCPKLLLPWTVFTIAILTFFG
mmetsp:Transcript_23487/g.67686  ORF Transcript_23487/g.67686 Transcript_23487/m.67686 type:complete len:726 (-) Transcript_23487:82-2259(-)